jgi:hypothetical protein
MIPMRKKNTKPEERVYRFELVFARHQHGRDGDSTWFVQTRDTLLQRSDQVRQDYWSLALHGPEEQERACGTEDVQLNHGFSSVATVCQDTERAE